MQPYRDDLQHAQASRTDLPQEYYDAPSHRLNMQSPYAASTQDIPLNSYSGVNGSQWSEKPRSSNRKKWLIIGGVLVLAALIAIGVGLGVGLSNNKKSSGSGSGSGSSSSDSTSSSTPKGGPKQTDPNDPSTFVRDSNLHQSLYGLAYTPEGSQLPDCGNSLANVIKDVQLMSQLTTRVRLYGADCNQTALVLEAVKQTKVNMTVWLGNYVVATDNNVAYMRQRDVISDAIKTYGTVNIGGVTVGNEFMLNYLTDQGATDPNSAIGNTGAALLIANIKDTRDTLTGLSLSKTLPVGTSDAGSYFNTLVLEAVDYGMANVHPWFAKVSAADAAAWTADFFQTTDVDVANGLSNKPQMYIAETGWPTKSSSTAAASNGPSVASVDGLQTFLDTFVCQANANGTEYFFFEFFDEEWKDKQFGGVEGWWGLFNADRTLKNVTIPDCQSP